MLPNLVLNESGKIEVECPNCKASLLIEIKTKAAPSKRLTIAEQLNGKPVDGTKVEGPIQFNPNTLIHTFDDLSTAKIVQRQVKCDAYQTKSLSTMSHKSEGYWVAL
jgi:hypothetical protein